MEIKPNSALLREIFKKADADKNNSVSQSEISEVIRDCSRLGVEPGERDLVLKAYQEQKNRPGSPYETDPNDMRMWEFMTYCNLMSDEKWPIFEKSEIETYKLFGDELTPEGKPYTEADMDSMMQLGENQQQSAEDPSSFLQLLKEDPSAVQMMNPGFYSKAETAKSFINELFNTSFGALAILDKRFSRNPSLRPSQTIANLLERYRLYRSVLHAIGINRPTRLNGKTAISIIADYAARNPDMHSKLMKEYPEIAADMGLENEIINTKPLNEESRPIALVAYNAEHSTLDRNHIEELIEKGYRVVYAEVKTDEQLFSSIIDIGSQKKISLLVMGGFGSTERLVFGNNQDDPSHKLDLSDEGRMMGLDLAQYMEENSSIVLESCTAAGDGKTSIQAMVSKVFANSDVFGSRTSLGKLTYHYESPSNPKIKGISIGQYYFDRMRTN